MEALGRSNSELSFAAMLDAATATSFRLPVGPTTGEWDDTTFDAMNFDLDLGFDTFLLATADDFMEPLAMTTMSSPSSPQVFSDYMDSSSCPSETESSTSLEEDEVVSMPVAEPVKRSRKRKNPATEAAKPVEKKTKVAQPKAAGKRAAAVPMNAEAERLNRRRMDILHEILEAWNTGGIEDMEEIADDVYDPEVTLISPDYSEGLKGVKAIMHHWGLLLDAFPDGIMEEYNIERDEVEAQKMNVTWVFSGTQIFPFFGVEPRHEKVTIRGKSFFTFKGEKICQMVLSWNYREALMQLMGVSSSTSKPASAARR